jgi:rare lipoprotein A
MFIQQKMSNTSIKSALRICLLAATSSVALVAGVMTVSTRTVQADARPPRPAATVTPAVPAASATPVLVAPQKPIEKATVARPSGKVSAKLHGIASWYGGVFHGRRTANGERFNKNAMTACHQTLPFGSLVRVVNLRNNRSVVVRITDRGNLFEGRIIDLSYGAARKLAMAEYGLARVELQVISLGDSHSSN